MNPLTPRSRTNRSSPGPSRAARGALSGAVLLLIPLVVIVGSDSFRAALDFTTGVLSLVSLTCSIIWGLVASDRLFLSPKQRLLAQGVHRATAIAALGFLLLHGTVKLVLGHVSAIGALIPFSLGVTGTNGLIGFGALAGLLMITTGVTGALRSSFASPARSATIAGRWRALHMLAYPAWCSALVHGLYAGREAKPWVLAMYCLCLAGVTGALALRAAPLSVKRKVARTVFAVLNAQPRPNTQPRPNAQPRTEPGVTPRREGLLPGMDTTPGPSEPAATRPRLLPQQRGFSPSYEERPGLYEGGYAERPRAGNGMAAAYRAVSSAPGARPLPLQEEHSGRWPAPSPPPLGEAVRPVSSPAYDTGPLPLYDTGNHPTVPAPAPAQSSEAPYYVTSDPYDTGSTPTYGSGPVSPYDTGPISPYDTGPNPLYEAGPSHLLYEASTELHETPTDPLPNPFEAPAAGEPWSAADEPWSASGPAGGRR